jgi:hypothetical protein
MSDTAGQSGAAAATNGDTLDLAGFDVIADYSLTGTGLTLANTGAVDANFIMASGNIQVNIAAMGTLTHKVIINGSPAYLENTGGGQPGVVARGSA